MVLRPRPVFNPLTEKRHGGIPRRVPPAPKDKEKRLTPVMQQFDEAKRAHPDAILFFRMGDFYEMFHDDAVLVSRLLNLTLTAREKGNPDPIPMAGVPHHAAHGYISKLLQFGHKVAICEQMADPSKVKGIVPRQVVRVVTPGLVTDEGQLDARANNYLVTIEPPRASDPNAWGIALLDLSTGELSAAVVTDTSTLLAEIARAEPRELLFGPMPDDVSAAVRTVLPNAAFRIDDDLDETSIDAVIDGAVDEPIAERARAEHPQIAIVAAARALRFAKKCTPGAQIPVRRITPFDPTRTLRIDDVAQAHLEIVRASDGSKRGSLLDVMDATVTPAGARLLRKRLLAPLYDVAQIRRRLDEVETFVVHARARADLREALTAVGDIERLTVRALIKEATPRDLGGLRDSLARAPVAKAAIRSIPEPEALEVLGVHIDECVDVYQSLAEMLVDRPPPLAREGGILRDGADAQVDELRALQRDGAERMAALEADLKEKTGIASLRIKFTRVFGWYIEVTKTHLSKVPNDFRRKQTVAGGERFTTLELDDLADKMEHAEARALEREVEIFDALVRRVAEQAPRIRALAEKLAEWDVASALADVAHRYDYARPEVDSGERIAIVDGRHPVVERYAAAGRFVPNDTTLDTSGERLWLVTGPNMAGKSTLMRQVAHIVLLAQAGSYVPAKSAVIGLVDRILSRVGASDNVARGESTFMVEMRETAAIMKHATPRSLVILDEIGRGTSTYDGLAIAWAVAEHIDEVVRCRALFATHYHELTELSHKRPRVVNYSVSAREHEGDVIFLHKLMPGPASRSYGVAVARLAGLPESVLARARSILSLLESGAPLPSGKQASMRAKKNDSQLDLFGAPAGKTNSLPAGDLQALDLLRSVDPDRLTPIEALQLVAKLKSLASSS
ncbi:MAG: DNA mismatch repair protein MutS [Polyangiaceae bacterium]|nr:DNA mismatch repair protein MutS [Polyangiaceae bacterium]